MRWPRASASKFVGLEAFRCISGRRGRAAIPRPEKPWLWPASMFLASSRARTCASASTTARISLSATEGGDKALGLMPELSPLTWIVGIAALVIGILAGHFGWGRRWPQPLSKLHPDYLTGLDYLVTEQPDRALDMFLKLMEANADTIETHFSLGSLYRRRGEVERAIRIHQNLLARAALAPEHREQALLALAQAYLRAGLLDRAEGLFKQVSEVPRLRASALDALRLVYERQHDWLQALGIHRQLARIKAAPPR